MRIMDTQTDQRPSANGSRSREPAAICPSDEELVVRVRAGERQLFELLMRRHNQRVFRAARAIVRRDDEAEDIMQDAYVRAYAHLDDFKGEASFSTWVTRIAVHEALARVRRERRFASFDVHVHGLTATPSESSPEQQVSDAELRIVLDRAIDKLPDEFRLAFVLRTVEQMSGAEAADVLGIPEQTIKTRLFRARVRLQRDLFAALKANENKAYAFHLTRCDRVVAAVFARLTRAASTGRMAQGAPPIP